MDESQIQPIDSSFRIQLPEFEGPLDLLLHLIQTHELDVLDLPISFVTERYLQYLNLMEELNLDVAAEYLLMAATLAHIKSKMLLPQEPTGQEEAAEEIDPRAELIGRLLEYQKYKVAAEQLAANGVLGRDVFARGVDAPVPEGPAPLAEVSLFRLLDAFGKVLERAKKDLSLEVTADRISIQDRTTQIIEQIKARGSCTFEDLFVGVATVDEVVVTFLALLEMAKRRLASIYQPSPESPLYVELRIEDLGMAAFHPDIAQSEDEVRSIDEQDDE